MTDLTVHFAVASEAERAATQLRAAGIPEEDVRIAAHDQFGVDRDGEAGVPDSAGSVQGLRGGEEAPDPSAITMTVDLSRARIDRADVLHMLHAAGGRTDD